MYSLVSPGSEVPPAPFRAVHVVVVFFLLLFFLTCALIFSGLSDPSTSSPSSSLVYSSSSFSSVLHPSSSSSSSSVPSLPLYSAIIDAGSAGSRVYLYRHRWLRGRVQVEIARDAAGSPIEKKLEPGLSSYAANSSQAAQSLDPLLAYLTTQLHSLAAPLPVSLYLLATAGLRFLPLPQQTATLDAAVSRVYALYPSTLVLAASHARVISGREEALFAWLALNDALGSLHRTSASAAASAGAGSTAGLVELGGASVQVAFEMTPAIAATLQQPAAEGGGDDAGKMATATLPSEYAATVRLHLRCSSSSSSPSSAAASLPLLDDRDHSNGEPLPPSSAPSSSSEPFTSADDGSSTFRLYTASYLGYGANSARSRHLAALLAEGAREDPCQLRGAEQVVAAPGGGQGEWTLLGSGDYDACRARLVTLLNLTAPCPLRPCTFNGVHQPLIDSAEPPTPQPLPELASSASPSEPAPPSAQYMPFYGFSELYYTSLHMLNLTGRYSYNSFSRSTRAFCSLPYSQVHSSWKSGLYGSVSEARVRSQCVKAVWMSVVLHEGLGFRRSTAAASSASSADSSNATALSAAGQSAAGPREVVLSDREIGLAGRSSDEREVVPSANDDTEPSAAGLSGKRRRLLQRSPAGQREPPQRDDVEGHGQPSLSSPASGAAAALGDNLPALPPPAVSPPLRTPASSPAQPARLRASHSASLLPIASMPNGQEVQWTLGAALTHLSAAVQAQQPQCSQGEGGENDAWQSDDGEDRADGGRSGEEEGFAGVSSVGSVGLGSFLRRMARLSAGWVLLLCGATSALMLLGLLCGAGWCQPRSASFGPLDSTRKRLRKSASHQQISVVIRRW